MGCQLLYSCLLLTLPSPLPPLGPVPELIALDPALARPCALPELIVDRLLGHDLEIDVEGPDVSDRKLDTMSLVVRVLTDPRIAIHINLPLHGVGSCEANVKLHTAVLNDLHFYLLLCCFVY